MSVFRSGCLAFLVTTCFMLSPATLTAAETPLLTPVSVQQGNSSDFAVYQSIPVDFKQTGMTGHLQILQDKRVTPEYRQSWGASADPEMALGPDNPLVKSLQGHPLKNGRVRLIDRDGNIVSISSFDAPLAKIETDYLYGTKFPTYLISVDHGIGMGSYAGPVTTLLEIREGRLIQLSVELSQSLKNGWQIVPASSGVGKEIEVVQCHPNYKNPNWAKTSEFVVEYSTYRFMDGQWHHKTNEKIGFWEDDEGWPPHSAFP